MSYYILRTNEFSETATGAAIAMSRRLYLLKKRDVPLKEQKHILSLKCSSIQRVTGISKLVSYLTMYTADQTHVIQPYILQRLKWNEAIELFGFDYSSDTSESDSESSQSI